MNSRAPLEAAAACPLPQWRFNYSNLGGTRAPDGEAGDLTSASLVQFEPVAAVPAGGGRVGLRNLGNTCFMSAALQCLSNVRPLTCYFLDGSWRADVNEANPLGLKGELAREYATLLYRMWVRCAAGDSLAPSRVRHVVGRHNKSFAGAQQQDSHEFLHYFLDALHEDLNRVQNKQYTEAVAANGRADSEVAEETLAVHRKRNDSRIDDLFLGLFKSTLVCSTCRNVATTFEPYRTLSLELPNADPDGLRSINVAVVRHSHAGGGGEASVPVRLRVRVPIGGTVRDLRKALAQVLCHNESTSAAAAGALAAADAFVVADVARCRVYALLEDSRSLQYLRPSDEVQAYEVSSGPAPALLVSLMQRRPAAKACVYCGGNPCTSKCSVCKSAYYCNRTCQTSDWKRHRVTCLPPDKQTASSGAGTAAFALFGLPLVLGLPAGAATNLALHGAVGRHVRRLIRADPSLVAPDMPVELPPELAAYHACVSRGLLTLRIVNAYGTACGRCNFAKGCSGCPVPLDSAPLAAAIVDAMKWTDEPAHLALDWSEEAYKTLFLAEAADAVVAGRGASDAATPSKIMRLEESFSHFAQAETLSGGNEWYCSRCKQLRPSTKELALWRVPPVLVVHLKRFQRRGPAGAWGSKIDDPILFPAAFSVKPFLVSDEARAQQLVDIARPPPPTTVSAAAPVPMETTPAEAAASDPFQYELVGRVNHFGGLFGGHYTAYVRNDWSEEGPPCAPQWWNCDDSSCTEIPARAVTENSESVYVLLYRRVHH